MIQSQFTVEYAKQIARDYNMPTLIAWNVSGLLQDIMQADMRWLWDIYTGACRWHRNYGKSVFREYIACDLRGVRIDHVGRTWARVALVSADGSKVWQADFEGDRRIREAIRPE